MQLEVGGAVIKGRNVRRGSNTSMFSHCKGAVEN